MGWRQAANGWLLLGACGLAAGLLAGSGHAAAQPISSSEEWSGEHGGEPQFQPDPTTFVLLVPVNEKRVPDAPAQARGAPAQPFDARYRTIEGKFVGIAQARMLRCRYEDGGNATPRRFVLWQGRRPIVSSRAAAALSRADSEGWLPLDVAVEQCPATLRELMSRVARGDPDRHLAMVRRSVDASHAELGQQLNSAIRAEAERKSVEFKQRRSQTPGPTAEEILPLVMTALREDRGWETQPPNRAIFRHIWATAHFDIAIEHVRCTAAKDKGFRCRFDLAMTGGGNPFVEGVTTRKPYHEAFLWTAAGELESPTLADTMRQRAEEDAGRMRDLQERHRQQQEDRVRRCMDKAERGRQLGIPQYVPCI